MINTKLLTLCNYIIEAQNFECPLLKFVSECALGYDIIINFKGEEHENVIVVQHSENCQFHKIVCKEKEIYSKKIMVKKEEH